MRHAPRFDHASVFDRLARPSSKLDPLLLAALTALLSAAACTTGQSHAGGGTGGEGTGNGGGSTGSGGAGGSANGSGGASSGSGGHVADAGSDAPSSAGGTAGTGCASLPLCDDFESGTLNTSLWTIVNGNSTSAGSATIDTIGAHGSGHSVKVMSNDRVYLRNSTVIGMLGPVAHVRFYARFMAALPANHGAMVVTHPVPADQYTQSNELRFGSQDAVFHWNTDSDVNIPVVGPGDSTSVGVTANTWYCFELTINTSNGHLNVSVDSNDIAGLTEDGVATPNIDQDWVGSTASLMHYTALADVNFGWASYGAGPMTIWFDDVALSSAPIGCPN